MKRLWLASTILAYPAFAQPTVITPGSGSITDAAGNAWTITASGSVKEGDVYTPGGGGTSRLAIENGVVFGEDAHGRGWFQLSGEGQYWTETSPPQDMASGNPAATTPQTPSIPPGGDNPAGPQPPPALQQIAQQPPVVCGTRVAGGFKTVNGRIVGPNGDFVARGINIRSNELGDVTNGTVTATFPGLNFVRINVRALDDPASLAGAVTYLTSRGIVAELEDHPDGGGGQDAWSSKPGDVAWYGRVAAYFKDNPYVWFGSFNEPAPDNLSAWQQATYQAIRGAGNNNPILMEVSGSRPNNLDTALTSNVYAAMTNVIADVHTYNYQSNNSTDQATVDANVIDMFNASHRLQSADGVMPVIDGEYGDSTDGSNVDAGGSQQIQAVINAGSGGPKVGSAAWSWVCGGADCLRNGGGGLTQFGQMVKLYINTSVLPCSPSEQNKIAQQTLNQVTQIATQTPAPAQPDPGQPAAMTTSPPPPSADPTVVQADQSAQQATDVVAQAAALRQSNP